MEIKAIISPLFFNPKLRFRGLKIGILYNNGDLEGSEYAEDLAKALRNALDGFGVEVGEPRGIVRMTGGGHPMTGLIMQVNRADDATAIVLQRALKAAGIDATGEVGQVPEMTIGFFVGVKPKPIEAR